MIRSISWDVYLEDFVTQGALRCVNSGGGVGRGVGWLVRKWLHSVANIFTKPVGDVLPM